MTNDITTTTAQNVDKQQLSARIVKTSTQLLEDYVLWHECGWSDEEFGQLIGKSAKTVKNQFLAPARKQGLIEPSKMARPNCAQNRAQTVENSTTTHPLPGNSDESPFIERNSTSPEPDSTSTLVDVEVLQPCGGTVSFSKEVCSTQPEMDTDCPQPSDELVSMDTEAIRQRDADFAELERLIECSHDIIQRHFDTRTDEASKLTEWQWRDLSQQYNSLKYTVDIRWERLKSELAEDRADHKRRLDQCFGKARDTSDSTVPQLD